MRYFAMHVTFAAFRLLGAAIFITEDAEQAESIISMAPSTTRILIDLGLADKIVACDTYSYASYGTELAEDLPQFDMMTPDQEQIISLSGGQLQRVMLARCIAQESPVLMLDEPMNHLDMKVQSEFLEFLMKWREKSVRMNEEQFCRPTLIGVFHDINIAAYIADEIALISEGRLLSFGQKNDMLKEELLEETYRFDVAGYLRKYDRYALQNH